MPFTVEEFKDLIRILEEQPRWRAELRRMLLTDELLKLPELVGRLAEEQRALASQVRELAQKVDELVTWQRGEAGRREGERYELNTVKRAPTLFVGGMGGTTDSPVVQKRLGKWIRALEGEKLLEADEDPTLADIIWWKGERVAGVEVSIKVNGEDVRRALRRAKTLRSIGVDAFGVVIGEDWTSIEAREMAKEKGVEWFVNGIPSDGMIAFRKI